MSNTEAEYTQMHKHSDTHTHILLYTHTATLIHSYDDAIAIRDFINIFILKNNSLIKYVLMGLERVQKIHNEVMSKEG